ncbi:aminodeoxychorismate/anthranilate synthase component II [Roseburia hominis]
MVLLIDNYDSFSYNLVQLAGSIRQDIQVVRNDAVTVEEVFKMNPSHIILSPGPGYPKDAGVCEAVVKGIGGKIPILGVCLGHQAICEAFGGRIIHAKELMHGKKSRISIDTACPVFRNMEPEIDAARYHSLVAEEGTIPEVLQVTARSKDGEVMAVRHKNYEIYGLQFHPESILTPDGRKILGNFLSL